MFDTIKTNVKYVLSELFKDFKFTKHTHTWGNEMIRTSWFGRHDFVPYVRIDLWSVGFRISYDPDYMAKFNEQYYDRLSNQQKEWAHEFIKSNTVDEATSERLVYKRLCHELENKGWVD